MQLHYAPASPFARKVRVAASELDLDGEIELVRTVVSPTAANPEHTRRYPLGQVPALVLADGTVLGDSTVILLYLDDRAGGGRLLPKGPRRFTVLTRQAVAQGAIEAAVNLRYETALRPEALRWQDWIDGRWAKIAATLAWFEAQPAPPSDRLDMAAIGLGCLLGYLDFRFPEVQWRDQCPSLATWFARVRERPSMLATLPEA